MKFQFKHQQFQADAAAAICNVFAGQRRQSNGFALVRDDEFIIGANAPLELNDEQILKNLRGVQKDNHLPISAQLAGKNFSVEMETGVGKTYTYIKTMYELNRRYGWSKFIVVVPSVAIREGVKKTFEVTTEHFKAEYGAAIRHFVYSSKNLSVLKSFVEDAKIWAMIVNVQAFSARSNDARRMTQELDEFGSQIPLEVVAQIRPIIIIDEPQSVEGNVARQRIAQFNPLMILRYSATHRDIFNLVYRLDAIEAYQRRLVKKIAVKGFEIHGGNSAGYIFFERINRSPKAPTATLTFRHKGKTEIKRITRKISVGDDLFKLSNGLEEYRGFVVTEIDGDKDSIEFLNGEKIFIGQVIGYADEAELRRLQIRETIQSHLEREAYLYERRIKVLSLFFIDEVAKYRTYDGDAPTNGLYAKMFEEEYAAAVADFETNAKHRKYLDSIAAQETHAGYFSVDKKNRVTNSRDDDVDAYDLIMRDKERLLDFETPVRFIFSHSALREGWDNPNVFQICTLKQSASDVRRRQEVGRGMRLCVNRQGERMDEGKIGGAVHEINLLTVVASESYTAFAAGLQAEIKEACPRPMTVNVNLFSGKKIGELSVDAGLARRIHNALIRRDYLNDDDNLTEKYFADAAAGTLDLGAELEFARADVLKILATVGGRIEIENGRETIDIKLNRKIFDSANFQELWRRISRKGFYTVKTDIDFVTAAADALNEKLSADENIFVVERGTLNDAGEFDKESSRTENFHGTTAAASFDLIGKMSEATGLTRGEVVEILRKMTPRRFDAEKFLPEASKIINEVKAAQVADGISYTALAEHFDTKIFCATMTGRTGVNAIETAKNLYDHLICDSDVEKNFAAELEVAEEVSIYTKLPRDFYIPTPAGKYNPDWAVVIRDKIYFVVETKGSDDENQLRGVEKIKTDCAKKYFDATADGSAEYRVVKDFTELREKFC